MNQQTLETPPPDEADRSGTAADLPPFRSSTIPQAALWFAGVLWPLVCFVIGFPYGPLWQSGELDDYARLLLTHKPSVPLYPFLLYSMISLVLLLVAWGRFSKNVFVRFGVFSGVLIAAEYWLVFQATAMEHVPRCVSDAASILGQLALSTLAVCLPWGIWRLASFVKKRTGEGLVSFGVALLAVLFLLFPLLIRVCLWCSTPWAFAAYFAVSIALIRAGGPERFRFSLAQLLGATSWFAAHCGAWRTSFIWMLQEYSRLPTSPHCFVCTAAANGHPGVVGSEAFLDASGKAYRVNDQLRALKAFELLLASISPSSHRACRWVYDRAGPRLAAALCHPVLADVGYFLLKPAEGMARICLALAIPGQSRLVDSLYRTGIGSDSNGGARSARPTLRFLSARGRPTVDVDRQAKQTK